MKKDALSKLVILDFIGNYSNNFMIPIALSGDRTYNKDNIRRYLIEGGRVIPGCSTIHFDEISKKRIFASVDSANFSDVRLLKEHDAAKWLKKEELDSVDWLPADITLVEKIKYL